MKSLTCSDSNCLPVGTFLEVRLHVWFSVRMSLFDDCFRRSSTIFVEDPKRYASNLGTSKNNTLKNTFVQLLQQSPL